MPTTPPAPSPGAAREQRLPLAGRLAVVGLGALATALGGVGFAYASSTDDGEGDTTWVTVVEHDCPLRSSSAGGGL